MDEVLQHAPYYEAIGQQRDELARSAASGACERVDGEDTLEQLGPGQARDGGMRRGAGGGGSAPGHDEVSNRSGGSENTVIGELVAAGAWHR